MVFLTVGIVTAIITVQAFTMDRILVERFLAALFFGPISAAAFVKWWSLVQPSREEWVPQHYSGLFRGESVQGVAFPLHLNHGNPFGWSVAVLGLDLLVMAGYVAITGNAVESTGARIVATILAGLFGLIMLPGGLAMTKKPPKDTSAVVLTTDALYLPRPSSATWLEWKDITGFNWAATQPPVPDLGSAPGTGNLRGHEKINVFGGDGHHLAGLEIKAMPEPQKLVDTLNTALHDANLRAQLPTPATATRLA